MLGASTAARSTAAPVPPKKNHRMRAAAAAAGAARGAALTAPRARSRAVRTSRTPPGPVGPAIRADWSRMSAQARLFSSTSQVQPPTPSASPSSSDAEPPPEQPPKRKPFLSLDARVWPIAASTLLMGTGVGVIFPIMPMFARDMGLSSTEFGMVVSVIGVTRLAFNIPAAWASDHFGRRSTLIGGPILSAIGMGMTATAATLSELMSYRFLTGVGGSFQMAGAQLYLSDISTPENRARSMAPIGMAFALGATVGPGLGGLMAEAWGIRAPFIFVAASVSLVSVANYFNLPETRKGVPTKRGMADEVRVTLAQWGQLVRDRSMRATVLLQGAYWAVASGCSWCLLPLLAHSQFGFSTAELGYIFALMSLVNISMTPPTAWLSDKFGRKRIIPPATALVALSLCSMPFATSSNVFLGLVSMYSIGMSAMPSTTQAFVADITSDENRSQALAMLRSSGDTGMIFGASALGLVAQVSNTGTAFAVASGLLIVSAGNFVREAQESARFTKS